MHHRETFRRGSVLYTVMELCDRGDLQHVVARAPQHRVPEAQALAWFGQIARGVKFFHALGIAHRDLSLENILLHGDVCKVADFGLSADATRWHCEVVGKPYYMAPEVVAGVPYDATCADVWSLGVLLFVLLTGSPLVEVASAAERTFQVFCEYGVRNIITAWKMKSLICDATIDLLEGMLRVDPACRPRMDAVVAHRALVLFAPRALGA